MILPFLFSLAYAAQSINPPDARSTCEGARQSRRAEPVSLKTHKVRVSLENGEDREVEIQYSLVPQQGFDPKKPTVVMLNGGPNPGLKGYEGRVENVPSPYQVLNISYMGADIDGSLSALEGLSLEQIKKFFTSNKHATEVNKILDKEGLENFVLWGESHGVQMALRVLDQRNRSGAKFKPKTLVLDSGMGRPITAADEKWNCQKGLPERSKERRTICTQVSSDETDFASLKASQCVPPSPEGPQQGGAPPPGGQGEGPPRPSKEEMAWSFAYSCGVFEPNVEIRKMDKSVCYDSPIDAAKVNWGAVKVLGIQSRDDCNNFEGSMDYLMDNVPQGQGAYLKRIAGGGHVMYRAPNSQVRECICQNEDSIMKNIFSGQVAMAKENLIQESCIKARLPERHQSGPPGTDPGPPRGPGSGHSKPKSGADGIRK